MGDAAVGAGAGAAVGAMGGPAAVSAALGVLDHHARVLVRHAIAHQAIGGGDLVDGVGELHAHVAGLLHAISLEHGSDAMATAADYAAAALHAGSLYPGAELDAFLARVAASVRTTSKELTRATPFGA
jgi:hypothetical protein